MVAKSVSHTKATATWCQKAAAAGPKSKARRPSTTDKATHWAAILTLPIQSAASCAPSDST